MAIFAEVIGGPIASVIAKDCPWRPVMAFRTAFPASGAPFPFTDLAHGHAFKLQAKGRQFVFGDPAASLLGSRPEPAHQAEPTEVFGAAFGDLFLDFLSGDLVTAMAEAITY